MNPFNFITHNVKGLGDNKKRKKQFRYLQDQVKNKGVIYMQETHSCNEKQKNGLKNLVKKIRSFLAMENRMPEVWPLGSAGIWTIRLLKLNLT